MPDFLLRRLSRPMVGGQSGLYIKTTFLGVGGKEGRGGGERREERVGKDRRKGLEEGGEKEEEGGENLKVISPFQGQ